MIISEAADFRKVVLEKIAKREFQERTGIHQSDLVYCLNKQALRKMEKKESTDSEILLFSLGYSTQRWLTGTWEDAEPRIVDGITVTCDSLLEDETPWELKTTFQSSSRPIEENLHWIKQIMAQCYVTGKTFAYLTRLELMGNWKSIYGKKIKDAAGNILYDEKDLPENERPTLHAYRLDFTQEEVESNWQWLKDRKTLFEAIMSKDKLLPKLIALAQGQSYECGHCSYAGAECKE